MRKLTLVIITIGLIALVAGTSSQGSIVLLSDNFNNGGASVDKNGNLATRQAGTLAPLLYKNIADYHSGGGWEPAITGAIGDRLTIKTVSWFTPASDVGIDHNFTDATNLRITADMFPDLWGYAWGYDVDAWLMLTFGQSQVFDWPGSVAFTTTNGIPTTGMAIVLRRYGTNEVYYNGNLVASSTLGDVATYNLRVDINVPAWDGSLGTVSVSTDSLSDTAHHVNLLTNFDAGFTNNYIGFGAYAPTSSDLTQHAVDNLQITAGSVSVTGTVVQENYTGSTWLTPIGVEFMQGGNVVRSDRVFLSPAGTYTIYGVETGTYDIRFSAKGCLSKIQHGVVINGFAQPINVLLSSGDINGDNHISGLDFSILSGNFDKAGD